ncbi:MAG TPA: DUF3179 domain-containing protein [Dehalococcoidia bacterium]|nr:DUF3179 domain-containing protein [Dehalococcoidia bacterium]HIK88432.1 DUF3179 domain-containing protein [Dehalococcoidia bacterium]
MTGESMEWWDWETQSIWSQPWGAAIDGELSRTRLTLLPYELVPWQSWRDQHPDTKVLVDERANLVYRGLSAIDRFVIGVSIGEAAKGFYFVSSAQEGVVNETVGEFPVTVFADEGTRRIHVLLRSSQPGLGGSQKLPDQVTFELVESPESPGVIEVQDVETNST